MARKELGACFRAQRDARSFPGARSLSAARQGMVPCLYKARFLTSGIWFYINSSRLKLQSLDNPFCKKRPRGGLIIVCLCFCSTTCAVAPGALVHGFLSAARPAVCGTDRHCPCVRAGGAATRPAGTGEAGAQRGLLLGTLGSLSPILPVG